MTKKVEKADSLEHLRPVAEKNAIQEVVFTLLLSDDTPLAEPEKFQDLHKGDLKETFPKFDTVTLQAWKINNNAVEASEAEIVGFSFEQYKPDGTLRYRLRSDKSKKDEGRPSWVGVNILEYERWSKESQKAYEWLQEILKIQDDLKIQGIVLHYVDALFWENDKKFPFSKIFQKGSMYLPAKIDDKAEKWSSKMAYEEEKGTDITRSELSVSVTKNIQNGYRKIRIDNLLTLLYETPVNMKDELYQKIRNDFDTLHNENKDIMKNILEVGVCKLIGLS